MFKPAFQRLRFRSYHHRARILEVERKFASTPASIASLRSNSGTPAFGSHTYLHRKLVTDIYFNSPCGHLINSGIYIRIRNGRFEAKIRKSGGYVNSTSLECHGRADVEEVVRTAMQDPEIRLDDLKPFAWMRTVREEWEVEGFSVVVDRTVFGDPEKGRVIFPQRPHIVGEVELCLGIGDGEDEEGVGREMDVKIEEFMGKYRWAFPREGVRGKLVAFGEWKRRRLEGRDGERVD